MKNDEMPKAYEAKAYEDEIYAAWEKSGFFNPDNLPGERSETFSIVLPPPNVTGTLHMGHAVMLAIQDVMTRFARMSGKKTLWVPGTDHAAIATQTKVEKMIMNDEGIKDPRHELGRDLFLKRVEKFASESHDIIVNQAKKIGTSLDWSREAFTLDAARNRSVNTAFKMMYDDGLIYQGDRIVNWCPRCKSTLADDEVEYKEEKTKFYYFKYGPVVIGTARPETKFADKVIIVHPDDPRYQEWIGKEMDVEWIEGIVKAKIVGDVAAEMEKGTGAMTITPAHSFVDFDLAKKYGFEIVKIIDEDGNLTSAAGSFAGKNAHDAREEIVSLLEKKGLVDHIDENYIHNLSVCYRCGTAIEPLPKLQWFIDVNKPFVFRASEHTPIEGLRNGQMVSLKQIMQHVVREKQIEIIPDRFEKTYFHWIDNLRDWCISRQVWYGHRVPAWSRASPSVILSAPEGSQELFVGTEAPPGDGWQQDPDTLDTWFSSGLWTVSTLGWPDKTDDLKFFHPTSVLETGYDILFFWVARMILMTTYVIGEVPFKQVYLHGLVRDEQGRKMSKSLGNIIDPLDMINQFGADATRLSLIIGTTPGNDTKLSEEKIAGYRNFTNKLWNIARFVLSQTENLTEGHFVPFTLADEWILNRLSQTTDRVTNHLEKFEFSQAGELLRDFTWSDFADWYLEIAKVQNTDNTKQILLHVLKTLLKLWHPFMPFVTEVIWSNAAPLLAKEGSGVVSLLMVTSWPTASSVTTQSVAESEFTFLQQLIVAVRNIRSQYQVEPKKLIQLVVVADTETCILLNTESHLIQSLARVEKISFVDVEPTGSEFARAVCGSTQLFVPLSGLIDLQKETDRITKELADVERYLTSVAQKLSDQDFLAKAPEYVVATMKQKQQEALERQTALLSQQKSL